MKKTRTLLFWIWVLLCIPLHNVHAASVTYDISYDGAGRVVNVTGSDDTDVSYTYFDNGRLQTVQISGTAAPVVGSPPVADISISPPSGTVDTDFVFDASGSSDAEDASSALKVRWDLDGDGVWDSGFDTLKTHTHQYMQADTYTIIAEIEDTDGNRDTAEISLTVMPSQTACLSDGQAPLFPQISLPSFIVVNDSVTLNLSDVTDECTLPEEIRISVDWENDGNFELIDDSPAVFSHQYTQAGNYEIAVNAADDAGNESQIILSTQVLTSVPEDQLIYSASNVQNSTSTLGSSYVSETIKGGYWWGRVTFYTAEAWKSFSETQPPIFISNLANRRVLDAGGGITYLNTSYRFMADDRTDENHFYTYSQATPFGISDGGTLGGGSHIYRMLSFDDTRNFAIVGLGTDGHVYVRHEPHLHHDSSGSNYWDSAYMFNDQSDYYDGDIESKDDTRYVWAGRKNRMVCLHIDTYQFNPNYRTVSTHTLTGDVAEMTKYGSVLYVLTQSGTLYVFDIANEEQTTLLETIDIGLSQGNTLQVHTSSGFGRLLWVGGNKTDNSPIRLYSLTDTKKPSAMSFDGSSLPNKINGLVTKYGSNNVYCAYNKTNVLSFELTEDTAPILEAENVALSIDAGNQVDIPISISGGSPPYTLSVTQNPSMGTATINQLTVTYTANPGAGGEDVFQVTAFDASGQQANIRVVIQIIAKKQGTIRFFQDGFEVDEFERELTISVVREGGSDGEVSIHYATADGTAVGNADFTPREGTLTWEDGDSTPAFFTVDITDDAEEEVSETFSATLDTPTGGAVLGAPATATVTIIDDDTIRPGKFVFENRKYVAIESDRSVEISVSRQDGVDGQVSVDYTLIDGTGCVDSDYEASNGTLTWPDGDDNPKSFTVPLVDDSHVECLETFRVVLGNPTGDASIGQVYSVVVVIDDEPILHDVSGDQRIGLEEGVFWLKSAAGLTP